MDRYACAADDWRSAEEIWGRNHQIACNVESAQPFSCSLHERSQVNRQKFVSNDPIFVEKL